MEDVDLDKRFKFHPATEVTRPRHQMIRESCRDFAGLLNAWLPDGREKSLAITHLEEVMMWSNAAIARQDQDEVDYANG